MHAQLLQSCPTLQLQGLEPTKLLCLRDFPGKNTEVGQHALLQIFLTQGPNPHLCTAGRFFIAEPPGKPIYLNIIHYIFIYIFLYFLVN